MSKVRKGILFVVSAPSGAGKTTLCREIFDKYSDLRQSVSFTTRPMRPGEREGVDYHFVDAKRFQQMIANGDLVEWAEVHGNLYGTGLSILKAASEQGADLLLEIDCQGARQIRNAIDDAVLIYVLPPSYEELERRLRGRETDAEEVIARRLENARDEISQAHWYDYLILNDDLKQAIESFASVIGAERCKMRLMTDLLAQRFPPN